MNYELRIEESLRDAVETGPSTSERYTSLRVPAVPSTPLPSAPLPSAALPSAALRAGRTGRIKSGAGVSVGSADG